MQGSTMRIRLALNALALAALAASASAAPLRYVITATGSGELNGTLFTDARVTFVAIGDTDDRIGSAPLYKVPVTATVTVNGLGTDTLTQGLAVFVAQNSNAAGLQVFVGGTADILDVLNSNFGTYDLTTPIGPLFGAPLINDGSTYDTLGGGIRLDTVSNGAFTAQAVPEPATMAALSLGALGLLKRRRKA
ncbi:PEP-CTERM sorting domain-containing protein [bacterium]|nr:MAG: PEP-CTERM sorting domain-containing protein [bacterium]